GMKGANYGWPNAEGQVSCDIYNCPLFAYGHGESDTLGCAITGGAFYNPTNQQFPADYMGKYFFVDYCQGWIRRFDPTTNTASGFALSAASSIIDLKVSTDGSLYALARGTNANDGGLFKFQYTAQPTPSIATQPSNTIVT